MINPSIALFLMLSQNLNLPLQRRKTLMLGIGQISGFPVAFCPGVVELKTHQTDRNL